MIDLDDTTNCPEGESCISCRGTLDLAVATIGSPVGVFCVTLCYACVRWEEMPRFSAVSAVRASLEHCGHLGIDADQMAEEMS